MITRLFLSKDISLKSGEIFTLGEYKYNTESGYLIALDGRTIPEGVYVKYKSLFKRFLFITQDDVPIYEGDAIYCVKEEGVIIEEMFMSIKDYENSNDNDLYYFHYSGAYDHISVRSGVKFGDLVIITSSEKLFNRNVVDSLSKEPIFNVITNYTVIEDGKLCRVVTQPTSVAYNRSNIAAVGILDFEGNQSIAPVDCIRQLEIVDKESIIKKHSLINEYNISYSNK